MIPFYRPSYDGRELANALLPFAATSKFEAAMAERASVRYGIGFAYGHAGLVAALKALELCQAEIILPAYTCAIVAHAVVASGNCPVFADIDLADFNMDLTALKRALTPKTRAVVATHMFGYPTDVDAIRAAIGDERVLVIEDSALSLHTLAAQGRGLRGDIGLYSFGIGKPLSTCKGGMLLTDSASLYDRIKSYRDKNLHGQIIRSQLKRWTWFLGSYLAYHRWAYPLWHRQRHPRAPERSETLETSGGLPPDMAMPFPEFQSRVGLVQVAKLNQMLARRRALAQLYDSELSGLTDLVAAPMLPGATFAYYSVRTPSRDTKRIREQMRARGIAIDQTFDYALPCLGPFRPFVRDTYPHAEQAARQVINLPIYPHLSDKSALYIARSLRHVLS